MATASDGLGLYADDANVANALVSVTTHVNRYGNGIATVPRDEFLDAVARELDVIVIPRSDLPTVTVTGHGPGGRDVKVGGRIQGISQSDTPDYFRAIAYRYLAIAEYLEQNPPVKVTTAEIDSLLAQVQTDRERSNYWKTRRPDLDAVEAYLGSLRDHLTTQDGAR